MKIGIMQPYFVPYIGYWQLMNAVDRYVIYDDVNFIKGGWINRNRILLNGQSKYINIPMVGSSPYKLINEIEVNSDQHMIMKNKKMLESAYKKAPYYEQIVPLIDTILSCTEKTLSGYITESIKSICRYLDIETELIISSSLKKDNNLRGQEKVISICRLLGGKEYYNAIGGQALYSYQDFSDAGLKLSFLKSDEIYYKQFEHEFCANLSILDVLMFNPKEQVKEMLSLYTLISG